MHELLRSCLVASNNPLGSKNSPPYVPFGPFPEINRVVSIDPYQNNVSYFIEQTSGIKSVHSIVEISKNDWTHTVIIQSSKRSLHILNFL